MVSYNRIRLTITDFRRNGGSTPQTYANMAELSFICIYQGNIITAVAETISASSEMANRRASALIDGNVNTTWHSDWEHHPDTTNWILLTTSIPFDRIMAVIITPHNEGNDTDYPAAFTIEAGGDGETYDTVANYYGLTSGWRKGVPRLLQAYPATYPREEDYTNSFLQGIAVGKSMKGVSYAGIRGRGENKTASMTGRIIAGLKYFEPVSIGISPGTIGGSAAVISAYMRSDTEVQHLAASIGISPGTIGGSAAALSAAGEIIAGVKYGSMTMGLDAGSIGGTASVSAVIRREE